MHSISKNYTNEMSCTDVKERKGKEGKSIYIAPF